MQVLFKVHGSRLWMRHGRGGRALKLLVDFFISLALIFIDRENERGILLQQEALKCLSPMGENHRAWRLESNVYLGAACGACTVRR